ncbi:MAG: hypothetical protein WAM66_08920 [Acidobacteriaceae bacterium]
MDGTDDPSRMLTPPPVSAAGYAVWVPSERRANYLSAGVIVSSAYDDNVLVGSSPSPVSDVSYSFWPTITLDRATSRLRQTFTYSSGYTIYQPTSALNETDQNASANFSYRLSPNMTVTALDLFQKSSNVFGQPFSYSGGTIPGTPQSEVAAIIAPFAKRTTNTANAQLTYQFRMNDMVGVAGNSVVLDYPDPSQTPGLYGSNGFGGSAFYSHRLSGGKYIGALYQYARTLISPQDSQSVTQTDAIFGFYTFYLRPNLSLSFAGGPQYFDTSLPPLAPVHSWSPAGTASLAWQEMHTTVVATYSRTVSAGGGLLGVFDSNSANLSVRWQFAHNWMTGVTGNYVLTTNAAPSIPIFYPGGRSISGSPFVAYTFGSHLQLEGGYNRLHQSYNGVAILADNPDSNREYISLSYQFNRPLGR